MRPCVHPWQVPITLAESSAALALLLAVGLYVLDISYWPSCAARRAAAGAVGFFLLLAALCASEKAPGLPIGLHTSLLKVPPRLASPRLASPRLGCPCVEAPMGDRAAHSVSPWYPGAYDACACVHVHAHVKYIGGTCTYVHMCKGHV